MPPLLAAIANAGRNGVLAKSAVVMDQSSPATTPPAAQSWRGAGCC
jgi:hypothetical protein